MRQQNTYKTEYCHMCGQQGSKSSMESKEIGYETKYFCNLICQYAKMIQDEG